MFKDFFFFFLQSTTVMIILWYIDIHWLQKVISYLPQLKMYKYIFKFIIQFQNKWNLFSRNLAQVQRYNQHILLNILLKTKKKKSKVSSVKICSNIYLQVPLVFIFCI